MIPVFAPWLSANVRCYVLDCVASGWISSLGQYVARFERDFATFSEARHAVARRTAPRRFTSAWRRSGSGRATRSWFRT